MLNLYHVNNEYCDFLRKTDDKVPIMHQQEYDRPFIGVVLTVKNRNYFAPLTSPKEKHKTMHSTQDFLKIDEGNLGAINFNNMIPVPICECNILNLNQITDKKYRNLLRNQLIWCQKNETEIRHMASYLYEIIYFSKQDKALQERCCQFKRLEEKCFEYMRLHIIKEEEFIYFYA